MKFKVLQDNLRNVVLQKIENGELTGLRLAQMTGFKQAHISNFLNKKRGLSLEGMDKVLAVQLLSVLDLLDPAEVNQRAHVIPPSVDEFENVPLAEASIAAMHPQIAAKDVNEFFKFKKNFLRRLRAKSQGDRSGCLRFVLIKLDARESWGMSPRLAPGSTLLLDRHYNALTPYRKGEFNMYAVLKNGTCAVRYVEVARDSLILRPHDHAPPIEVLPLEDGKSAGDYLVGGVCYVGLEA